MVINSLAGALISKEKEYWHSGVSEGHFKNPHCGRIFEPYLSVGWGNNQNRSQTDKILSAPVYSAIAEDRNGHAIGCALLLSDEASFYYVKDLMVHPEWQHKQVGSMLMKKLTEWLDANVPTMLTSVYLPRKI
jgi:GNAT superfamily N-acetyltransferase